MARKMITDFGNRQARRMQADREELAERLARAMPRDGTTYPQPGVNVTQKWARPDYEPLVRQ